MNKLILTLIFFLPFVLFSCSDDKDNEDTGINKTYKVRYEASCDNPDLTMRILYSTKHTTVETVEYDSKVVYVKSPFSVELEMKYAEFCYISAQVYDEEADEIADTGATFTTSITVDGVKKFTATNKNASISYYALGSE
ncbi:hypothetical protein JGH11_14505 [Dysgonomonas sp. Marseille-P4677]|uniref:hypothetical protein n=1 Tax=Dysgonomonas sp. Marseille-P4677 TaxID=2364790 RepID=UPI0019113975|nr:hypothetical protein [Dysgonomonas sp. Marseille-P4677]MBK5722086.1 hypothetical protein [Dysgonomonas sp. Marseille-P4677]